MSVEYSQKAMRLLERLRTAPFPELGKQVGDFVLYDSLVAGALDCASRNLPFSLPSPDPESLQFALGLIGRNNLDGRENAFCEYWRLLDEICTFLESKSL